MGTMRDSKAMVVPEYERIKGRSEWREVVEENRVVSLLFS